MSAWCGPVLRCWKQAHRNAQGQTSCRECPSLTCARAQYIVPLSKQVATAASSISRVKTVKGCSISLAILDQSHTC